MFLHRGSRNLGVISAAFRLGTLICKKIPLAKVRKCNPVPDRPCLRRGPCPGGCLSLLTFYLLTWVLPIPSLGLGQWKCIYWSLGCPSSALSDRGAESPRSRLQRVSKGSLQSSAEIISGVPAATSPRTPSPKTSRDRRKPTNWSY